MANNTVSKGAFKSIQLIYGVLMIGILIFSGAVYAFAESHVYTIDFNDVFFIAVPIVAISGIFLGKLLSDKMLSSVKISDTLSSKIVKYQSATIVRGACLEGSAFLSVVAAFVTSNMIFIVIALVLVVVMYMTFPSKEKFKAGVALSMKEKSALDKL